MKRIFSEIQTLLGLTDATLCSVLKLHLGAHIHRLLVESAHGGCSKDDFREAGGFLVVVHLLSVLESTGPGRISDRNQPAEVSLNVEAPPGGGPQSSDADGAGPSEVTRKADGNEDDVLHERLRVEIFKLALSILSEAVARHPANMRSFESSVGWDSLREALKLSTMADTSPDHFFAALLGLSLGEVSTFSGRFVSLRSELAAKGSLERAARIAHIEQRVSEHWSGLIMHPRAVAIVLDFSSQIRPEDHDLHLAVIAVIEKLALGNRWNQVALAKAHISSQLLPLLNGEERDPEFAARQLRIVRRLLSLGVSIADGRYIFKRMVSRTNPPIDLPMLDLLLDVAPQTRSPNMVTFDLSACGHSSMALSSLRRPFPPGPTSRGFTLIATISIERIEPSLALELLHLFDSQRTCAVKLTIEPGTGQLNYSTTNEPPPIRFKAFHFAPGHRYHVVLAHARPRGGAKSSLARLYVNGRLVEEQQAPWPSSLPPNQSGPIRAIFGTPPNSQTRMLPDASGSHRRHNRLIWSLGPTYMLDDVIVPDLPLVLHELSPRYTANAQDSLGRFLTYRASTNINLHLDAVARELPRGGPETEKTLAKHPLVTAIAGRSSQLFAEERFYFVLNPANTAQIDRFPRRANSDSLSGMNPSGDGLQMPSATVILNQVLPSEREALASSFGYAKLFGEPVISTPCGLDETVWKLGGCAVLLRLVERANTVVSLTKVRKRHKVWEYAGLVDQFSSACISADLGAYLRAGSALLAPF